MLSTPNTSALGIAGRTSERAAQGAVAVAGALLAVAVVSRIVGWLRAPVNGNDSSIDAGDAFDRLVTPRDIRSLRHAARAWTASPMRRALTVLATFALVVAFGLGTVPVLALAQWPGTARAVVRLPARTRLWLERVWTVAAAAVLAWRTIVPAMGSCHR